MKIELLEKVMHGRDTFEAGDIRTVPDALGTHFCAMGWAKDTDGQVETGKRNTEAVVLTPDSINQAVSAGEI